MNENKNHKIVKAILSLIISFLMILIISMFARVASNTILPENSVIAIFINDYLDMMSQKIDKISVRLKIKRNSVSQYQVDLITQSISDYIGYSMYQTSDTLKNYKPNVSPNKKELDKYKNDYYKMTLENPYLRGMTVFNINGKMLLNLYLSKNKSWPLELQTNLINEIKQKGSLVLNATNENSFYVMEYLKNDYGEIIVSTRNDYSYVSDIAMYYQVADKRLYVSDPKNSVYNVREAVGDNNIEKVSSVINKYAYYKKQPSFVVNDSLSVSMIAKEYPNYFELIVLFITALLILFFQLIIKGIINFFKYIMQIKSNNEYVESIKGSDKLVNDEIVNTKIPISISYEETPPMIQKVHYKIPDEYIKYKEDKEYSKFNIRKDIINIVSNIKDEINIHKNRFENLKNETEKLNKDNILEEIETEIDNEVIILQNDNIISEYDDKVEYISLIVNDSAINEEFDNNIKIDELKNDVDIKNSLENIDNKFNEIKEIEELPLINNIKENIENKEFNKIIVKNNSLTLDNNNEEYKNKIENDYSEVNKDILDSYNKVTYKKEEDKNEDKSEKLKNVYSKTDDVFAAFDKMLSSIINKAEEDAKKSIGKNNY